MNREERIRELEDEEAQRENEQGIPVEATIDGRPIRGRLTRSAPPSGAEGLGGMMAGALANPGGLRDMFSLDDTRAQKVKGLIAGAGAGASVAFLGKSFEDWFGPKLGPMLAGALGGAAGAALAKKIIG